MWVDGQMSEVSEQRVRAEGWVGVQKGRCQTSSSWGFPVRAMVFQWSCMDVRVGP